MAATFAVTGVATGIGAELARILKEAGHTVVGFDLHATSANLDHFIPLDLNDPASITAAAAQVDWRFDGLCNNAGVPPRVGLEATILHVNFIGQRLFTEAMLPRLKEGASIVNMASRAGAAWRENLDQVKRLGALSRPDQLERFVDAEQLDAGRCYNLSKEAMIVWTMAIAEDMIQRGLRVNSLSPGGVATGILDDFRRVFGDRMARNLERAKRPGRPDEIARIAAFVLGADSNWLKGADIAIDGGIGAFNAADMLDLAVMKMPVEEVVQ